MYVHIGIPVSIERVIRGVMVRKTYALTLLEMTIHNGVLSYHDSIVICVSNEDSSKRDFPKQETSMTLSYHISRLAKYLVTKLTYNNT